MFALISANLVNAAANWILIHGKLGMPALGVAGAAWATFAARVYMCGLLGATAWWTTDDAGSRSEARAATPDRARATR